MCVAANINKQETTDHSLSVIELFNQSLIPNDNNQINTSTNK